MSLVGRTISHYRVLEELGGGGMGVVYKAEDARLKRPVALKLLPSELMSSSEARERLIREAQAASSLDHPNICTIYEIGETDDGQMFIAMAYYPGETLKKRLAHGPLPIEEAVRVAIHVAKGLERAHAAGITHRDVKPANVMITERDEVKLLDFGIARIASDVSITREGTTLGTLFYMSPEQMRGEAVDPRTDVWSLGVLLYELLAGRRPFDMPYEQAVMYAVLHHDPPLLNADRPDVPADLAAVVDEMLVKDRDNRVGSAADVVAKLEAFSQPADRAAPRRPAGVTFENRPVLGRRLRIVLYGLLLIPIAALIFLIWMVPKTSETSSDLVAVFPFTLHGSQSVAYLADGMSSLLSTKLDGAGDLRAVDSNALLSAVASKQGPLQPETARSIAAQFGAGLFIMGDLFEIGGRIRLQAALYRSDESQIAAETTAEGVDDAIFDLVDTLAVDLLGAVGGAGARMAHIAAVTTSSLPALRAYLEGESAMRAGNFEAAVDAFQHAVAIDTAFALGYYRLSTAAEWLARADLAQDAADRAYEHAGRLTPRDERLLQAFVAYRQGRWDEAERRYRSLLGSYPDDAEVLYQLGEVVFHYGPMHGGSLGDARAYFERITHIPPYDTHALVHLARIAAFERDIPELVRVTSRYMALTPKADRALAMRALRAFGGSDESERQAVLEDARTTPDNGLIFAVWDVGLYLRDFDAAEQLLRVMAQPSHAPEVRMTAMGLLAHLEMGRGRRTRAMQWLEHLETLDPVPAVEFRAQFAMLPLFDLAATQHDRQALEEHVVALESLDVAAARTFDHPSVMFSAHESLHPIIRGYLLGMLNARMGRVEAARGYEAQLRGLPPEPETGSLTTDLAEGIRAQLSLSVGDLEATLATLERISINVWYARALASSIYAVSYERFLKAELLFALKRYDAALPLFKNIPSVTPYEMLYVPITHLRMAQTYDDAGDVEQAVRHYERFIAFWEGCDDDLSHLLEQARTRLAALDERST